MKRANLTLAVLLTILGGCGSGIGQPSYSPAEARALCNDLAPTDDGDWDVMVVFLESMRDDGISEFDAMRAFLDACAVIATTDDENDSCVRCVVASIDALW